MWIHINVLSAGDNLRQLYDRWRTDWPTPRRLLDFWRDALVDDELERMLGPTDTVRLHKVANTFYCTIL